MELISATLYLGESRMAAVVNDGQGKQRRIELQWRSANLTDSPTPTWLDMVRDEVEQQISLEKNPSVAGLSSLLK